MQESAPVSPERAQLRFAVQDFHDALEAVERARTVRIPPRDRNVPTVRVDQLDPRALVQPVLAVCAAEAGLLRPTPRGRPGAVRVTEVVRPHHPRFDPRGDAAGTIDVARPYACAESEDRCIR